MKMRIISDNEIYEKSMMVALERTLRQKPEFENLILVDVNAVRELFQERADRIGIKIAVNLAKKPTNIIILTSYEHEDELMKTNEDFAGLMTLPNVSFVDIRALEKVPAKYRELASRQKKLDGEFEGVSLEGLFVDALGILFDENWELFPGVKQTIEEIAAVKETKIFVISDSDTNLVKDKLASGGITWPVMSKYNIRGATLECVIDNLSQEEFEDTYKIKAPIFIRATPGLWLH